MKVQLAIIPVMGNYEHTQQEIRRIREFWAIESRSDNPKRAKQGSTRLRNNKRAFIYSTPNPDVNVFAWSEINVDVAEAMRLQKVGDMEFTVDE